MLTQSKAILGKLMPGYRAALLIFFLLGLALGLSRCALEDQGAYSLNGVVAAGLVKNATVSIYTLSSTGIPGKLLAQTRTDSKGIFRFTTSLIPQPIEIVATSGSYSEEAGGAKVELQSQQIRLRLAKFVFGQTVGLTPLTEIAAARSQILIDEVGASLSDSITTANIAVAMAAGLTDVTVAPVYPNDAVANGVTLSSNRVNYALFISGLSKFSQAVLPNSLSAMVGFSRDFAPDGTFDGKANGTTVYFGNSVEPVPATGWSPGLLNAMIAYATSADGITAGFGGASAPNPIATPSACTQGLSFCSPLCVNLKTNVSYCGACNNNCLVNVVNATPMCSSGSCMVVNCNSGYGNCDGNHNNGCEINTTNNVSHCGVCNTPCAALANATVACAASACVIGSCNTGFANCDATTANGCEINLTSNTSNCGACGVACTPQNAVAPTCIGGICGYSACNTGYASCDSNAVNGCEINLTNNTSHCGACGVVCTPQNAVAPACTAGICGFTACNTGYASCDSNTVNGCEINLTNNTSHCGACGVVCSPQNAAAASCTAGACGYTSCNSGYASCDGNNANGCEANLNTSTTHCGACGVVCTPQNAVAPACTTGVCDFTACNTGYASCDSNTVNGCETNLTNNTSNCGSCGVVCSPQNAAAATCTSGACGYTSCNAGYLNCDANNANGCEVNKNTNTSNCGSCGNVCSPQNAAAATCTSGVCGYTSCNSGYGSCDSNAVNGCETNLNTSTSNCGACGTVCSPQNAAAASCTSGACGYTTCNAGYGNCDSNAANGCETNINTSTSNCGSCGTVCSPQNAAAATCTAGACGYTTCNTGYLNCDANNANGCEVNKNTNVNNCGACGTVCSTNHATPSCTAGVCGILSCDAGWANCDGNASNGCETNISTSTSNCGACGTVCSPQNSAGATCTAGACGYTSCNAGYGNCDGNNANGCEANINTSTSNCGACGTVCSPQNAAGATCTSGACGYTSCNTGYLNCDGNNANGCEVNKNTNTSNCGSCGNVCSPQNAASATCTSGTCGYTSCNTGYGNCDSNAVNGCEANLNTSTSNCGACGTVCSPQNAAGSTCTSGACGYTSCNTGYLNCDGNNANGCEVNKNTNTSNCGSCGNVCAPLNAAGATCTSGACGYTSCNSGYGNCDANAANGCETNLKTNSSNCGTCGNACTGGKTCSNGTCI